MRFGGHETFHIREGWLHKGLRLLVEQPERLTDEYAADWLGVGRNMAKSIRHWLKATGLAFSNDNARTKKPGKYAVTRFGSLVWKHDKYFVEPGTWWAIHINLVNNPDFALTWNWFFNKYRVSRFEKHVCLDALQRFVSNLSKRTPSSRTLDRDLACLLGTYARRIPPASEDPEEALDCPMTELGLMTYYKDTGAYVRDFSPKPIPYCLTGYAFAKAFASENTARGRLDVQLHAATTEENSPGVVLGLDSESLFEQISLASSESKEKIQLVGQASERSVRIPNLTALDWLSEYYELQKRASNAA